MACLKIFTNLSKAAIPKNVPQKIIPVLSRCVKKHDFQMIVTISPDCIMSFAGENRPGAIASLESVGNLNTQQNMIIAKNISEIISKELGVEKQWVFISFYDLLPHNASLNGVIMEIPTPNFCF